MCGVRRLPTPQSLPQQVVADVQAWSLAASGVFGRGRPTRGCGGGERRTERLGGAPHRQAPGRGGAQSHVPACPPGQAPATFMRSVPGSQNIQMSLRPISVSPHSPSRLPFSLSLPLDHHYPPSSPTHTRSHVQRTRSFPGRGRPGRAVVEGVYRRVPLTAAAANQRVACRILVSHKPSGRIPRRRSCRSAARCPSLTLRTSRRRSSSAFSRSVTPMAHPHTPTAREYMRDFICVRRC